MVGDGARYSAYDLARKGENMIAIEVKRINRDHDILAVLQFDHDTTITSKHYKRGVQVALELAAESYENDCLLILIYHEDFRHVLKFTMETYSSCSYIWADLYEYSSTNLIRRMYIAC